MVEFIFLLLLITLLVTVTNAQGETLAWGSSGASGFKGTRRATPYAATTAVEKVLNKAKNEFGVTEVEIYVKGPGAGTRCRTSCRSSHRS